MKKIFILFFTLLTLSASGLGFIQPEQKVFTKDSMYVGNVKDNPNYIRLYNDYSGEDIPEAKGCKKEAHFLNEKEGLDRAYIFYPEKISYPWFFPYEKNDNSKAKSLYEAVKSKSEFFVELPKSTYLLAIANGNIDPTQVSYEDPYPSGENITKGVRISYIFADSKYSYRITYEGLNRVYCDLQRKADDKINGNDIWRHTLSFRFDDKVLQRQFMGTSGLSSIPKSSSNKVRIYDDAGNVSEVSSLQREDYKSKNDTIVHIIIERAEADSNEWEPCSVQSLYRQE